jgi:hypothetical protein
MQRVSPLIRSFGVQFGHFGGRILLASVLLLVLATPALVSAQAPAVQAAPLAFKNSTHLTLEIEAESIRDGLGLDNPIRLKWTVKPGDYTYLADQNNVRIQATRFSYRVQTPGKTSRWSCNSNGPGANGSFTVEFTPENLRTHTGEVLVMRPPFQPPPQNGPTQEQMNAAGGKVILAVIAHAAAREVVRKNPNGIAEQIAEGIAKGVRDEAMRSALRDLFPGLTQGQSRDIQTLLSGAADGRLNIRNLGQQEAKQRLINDLRSRNPDLADAAAVAEFIYVIHQLGQQR